jgi:hypothetical protein
LRINLPVGPRLNETLGFRTTPMRVATLVLAVTAVAMSRGSIAACVLDDYSVEAEYAQSVKVLVAKVVSNAKIQSWELTGVCSAYTYSLKIKESFRGTSAKTIDVVGDDGRGCFPLAKGKTYVLFLYEQLGSLAVDPCGNSGLVSEKQDVMMKLRARTRMSDAGRTPN